MLVAELLLQRSRSTTVAGVHERLFARWPDATSLAAADVREIEDVIRPLGLVRRAATLRKLAAAVVSEGVPRDPSALLELPGVGPYVANATSAVAFGRRAPVVDGVTARVYRRYFDVARERDLARIVEEVTPRGAVREWNWAVLDLAASVCLPKVPRCGECPLAGSCAYR